MSRSDFLKVTIIGGLVGLLIQPILANVIVGGVGLGIRIALFVGLLIMAPVALFVAHLIDRSGKGFYQFAQFAAVGTLNSFIGIGILNLETYLYGTSIISNGLYALFAAISFLCGTTNSFFWNKNWTFKDSNNNRAGAGTVTSFYVIALIGWALSVGVGTLVKAAGPASSEKIWTDVVAPLAGIAVSFLWNFFGYKYFVFRKESKKVRV